MIYIALTIVLSQVEIIMGQNSLNYVQSKIYLG